MPFRRRTDRDVARRRRGGPPSALTRLDLPAPCPPEDDVGTAGAGRREGRLDPVRWRRPGGSTLLRWTAVAVLLCAAAGVAWAREPATTTAVCAPAPSPPVTSAPPERNVPPGAVGVPVRLAEPAALGLLRPGDRVDLMAAGSGKPRRVAADALVLGVSSPDETAGLFLAVTPAEATGTVDAPAETRFSVLVRPR